MRSVRFLIVIAAAAGLFALANAAHAQQKMVLWEEFTQWNCPPCGTINPYLEQVLAQNWKNVIHIWYHDSGPDANDDPMYLWSPATSDLIGRQNYNNLGYTHSGIPAAALDGKALNPSGGYRGSPQDLNYDQSAITAEEGVSTPVSIDITETPDGSGGAAVHIVVHSTQALTGSNMLRVAVVKAVIDSAEMGSPYRNPEREFQNTVERMLPDYNGTAVSISNAGGQQAFDFTYHSSDIMPTANDSKVFIVAWVQDDGTKNILNAASDYYASSIVSAPTLEVASPGQTNSFTPSITNSSSTPMTIISTITTSAPSGWQVNATVNQTALTTTDTTILAPGSTANYNLSFVMTGGKGVGSATLMLQQSNGDTVLTTSNSYYSASNDLNTVIIDGTGGTNRAAVYSSALKAMTNQYNTIYGTVPSTVSSNLISSLDSVKNIIYIAGANAPSDNDYLDFSNLLSSGGNLFLTGEVLYTEAAANGDGTATSFLSNMLHTSGESTNDIYETWAFRGFTGVNNDVVSNGITSTNVVPTGAGGNVDAMKYWPDAIKPKDAQATAIFHYTGALDTACGVRVQSTGVSKYKAVYLTFGLEAMASSSARNKLMQNIIAWFNQGSTGVNESAGTMPTDINVMQNYPNPFGGTTNIQFTLPEAEHVTLNVYDMQGSLVASLANGMLQAGSNSIPFDGTNLPAGVYEYRLTTPAGTMSHLMSLVK